jgi:hypothetical protein
VVVLAVPLQSITWCIPHLGVSYVDHTSSRIRAIAHNSNHGNSNSKSHSSNNNSSSTVPLLHRCSRLPSGHHSCFPPATFHASTAGRWATLLENVACLSKATHRKLPCPWSINRGTTVEEIRTGEEVLAGTFFLNKCSIIILFDSGASHDFVSFTCAKKAKLSLVASGAPYVISTPRGRVDANQVA